MAVGSHVEMRDEEKGHAMTTKDFTFASGENWIQTSDGNLRRVLAHTDELMLVEFKFDKGAEGALHSHPHVQSSFIAEGRFEVTINGFTEVLSSGDAFIVGSGLVHGVKALEAGRLIDNFTPQRADFLA
jgi:quercetin dioxygenase-like cupin family protein